MKHFILRMYFNAHTRSRIWKKLASLLRHKITEHFALALLRDRFAARKHPLTHVFDDIIEKRNQGRTLDDALSSWIPHEEIMLIRGGIQSARLPEALIDCVTLIEARKKITDSLSSAITYPLVLLLGLIALLLTVALYVVPELSALTNPALWDGAAAALYSVSQFIASSGGVITLVLLVVVIVSSLMSLPIWTGSWRKRLDSIPPWSIYRLLVGSVWLFTIATLLRANIQLDFILKDMLKSKALRPWLRERVTLIQQQYQVEGNFGSVLQKINLNFPDRELVEDLAVYAIVPGFEENLYSIAHEWLQEGTEKISTQTKILNGGLLIGIGLVLCGLGIAISSIQQQLSNMGGM